MVNASDVFCSECKAKNLVPTVAVLAYGEASALDAGCPEAYSSGDPAQMPYRCTKCQSILALPGEMLHNFPGKLTPAAMRPPIVFRKSLSAY
jgi:hypothetical protein